MQFLDKCFDLIELNSVYRSDKTLLINGYVRHLCPTIYIIIPSIIIKLICTFYPQYTIYGVGKNKYYELGLVHNEWVKKYCLLVVGILSIYFVFDAKI